MQAYKTSFASKVGANAGEKILSVEGWKDFLQFVSKTKPIVLSEQIDTLDVWDLTQQALEQDLVNHSSSFSVEDFIPLYQLVLNVDPQSSCSQLKQICDVIFKKHI